MPGNVHVFVVAAWFLTRPKKDYRYHFAKYFDEDCTKDNSG